MVYQNGKTVAISQASASSGLAQDIYSTEEQVIGRWIDGRPIYRRCFIGTSANGKAEITSGGYVDTLLNVYGSCQISNGSWLPIAYPLSLSEHLLIGVLSNGNLYIQAGGSFAGMPYKAVVEYTKTTDDPSVVINPIQQDSTFHVDLQDTIAPTVMPVTADTYSEAEVII